MVGVEQWAEIRRLVLVERRSQRQAARLTGVARDRSRRDVASTQGDLPGGSEESYPRTDHLLRPDGLLRRHDYTVDILGGATGLSFASDYREIDGLIFPTTRRVYGYEGDYQLVPEPLLVAVDISQITLS